MLSAGSLEGEVNCLFTARKRLICWLSSGSCFFVQEDLDPLINRRFVSKTILCTFLRFCTASMSLKKMSFYFYGDFILAL